MNRTPELQTERLLLRRWEDRDRAPFAALNADPGVMEHFPSTLTRAESDAFVDRIEAHFERYGFGLWAVETMEASAFIGFVGLSVPAFEAPFMPALEVGWRLARPYWGRGYASEGARAVVGFGFEEAALDEIVSFTVPANLRSRRVMERLGMSRDPRDDFEHPALPEGHQLRPHVLYRLRKRDYPPPLRRA